MAPCTPTRCTSGLNAFNQWLTTPVAHGHELRQDFLAKLYFAQQAGPDSVAKLAERQQAACVATIAQLERQMANIPADQPYAHLVYQFRLGQMRATLAWLNQAVTELAPAA